MSDSGCSDFQIRPIPPDSADHHRALALAIGESGHADPAGADSLRRQASQGKLSTDLLFGAFRQNHLVSAGVAVESPGAAAMVFVPLSGALSDSSDISAQLLDAILNAAWARSLRLLQVLGNPASTSIADDARVLDRAGFRYVTRLVYLHRPANTPIRPIRTAADLCWVTFSTERAGLFCRALEATYAQSLDCPELTGLRTTSQVLVGHRAAGDHDPSLWSVAMRNDEPVGVMLLTRMTDDEHLEIVYMGVAQPARGTGVANALLSRAVEAIPSGSATTMTLAVDLRNTPARALYARWGFSPIATREAWIASPPCA